MTRTLLRLLLTTAAGFALAVGGMTAAVATTAAATSDCTSPKWHVTWTTEDADTMQECGGETIASHSGSTGANGAAGSQDELPLTGGSVLIGAVFALALVGMGAGLFLITRQYRRVFRA
jgi:hypothetical protein